MVATQQSCICRNEPRIHPQIEKCLTTLGAGAALSRLGHVAPGGQLSQPPKASWVTEPTEPINQREVNQLDNWTPVQREA